MGGPAQLPGALPPPKQKRSFPWSPPALPVPKPARAVPRRRGQDPFADIVAGVQDMIQNIGKGIPRLQSSCSSSTFNVQSSVAHQLSVFSIAGPKYDLVLSSGFLAFASHSGFLKAVEEVTLCSEFNAGNASVC